MKKDQNAYIKAEAKDKKTLLIKVFSQEKEGKRIPVQLAINILQGVQNIVFSFGDHLKGNLPRSGGDFPKNVKEICSLEISDLQYGSMCAELQITEKQTSFPGDDFPTLGERAIAKANEFCNTLLEDKEMEGTLETLVDNPKRRIRILKEFYSMWPGERSEYGVSFSHRKITKNLDPKRKPIIEKLLHPKIDEGEERIYRGRLFEYRADSRRSFLIDTSEKIIKGVYHPDVEDYVSSFMRQIVELKGIVTKKGNEEIIKIEREDTIETIESLSISEFQVGDRTILFNIPILLKVEYQSAPYDRFILSNEELKLLAVSSDMKGCMDAILEQLEDLWDDYVLADEEELNWDAVAFKKFLLSLVGVQ